MSIKFEPAMTDNPVFKELQAAFQDAATDILSRPHLEFPKQAEAVRALKEMQYRMMYESGVIDSMPTVSIKWFDVVSGAVELDVCFMERITALSFVYDANESENSAIDSPLDNG